MAVKGIVEVQLIHWCSFVQAKISAKAQRKVAREIKTARAFGLMPFTTMGTKAFVFGNTMEDLEDDYKFDGYSARRPVYTEEKEENPIEA